MMNLGHRNFAVAASVLIHFLLFSGLYFLNAPKTPGDMPIVFIDLTNKQMSQTVTETAPVKRQQAFKKSDSAKPEVARPAAEQEITTTTSDAEALSADGLPDVAADHQVTANVKLLRELKIPYPDEARKNNIDGAVVMDLIIDDVGKVRTAELIRGPGFGLNEAAMAAIRNFLFRPAKIGEKSVAVKIRYSYRFKLNAQ